MFSSKQIVTMVVAVSAAVVLAPVGVMAATGQLVNIADPGNAGRVARVAGAGTLQVETRPGVVQHSFNRSISTGEFAFHKLYEVAAPNRIALTEVSVGTTGSTYPEWQVLIVAYVQTTGTGACGTSLTGYTKHVLREFMVPPQDTRQLLFNGPPLVVPSGAAGKLTCVGFAVQEMGGGVDAKFLFGATGYTFS